jgi:hypothetical protein
MGHSARKQKAELSGTIFGQPPFHLKQTFLADVKAGKDAQSFVGLCTDAVSRYELFETITPFEISSKSGSVERICCIMCSPQTGKFYSGMLVHFSNLQRIGLVGRNCGHHAKSALSAFETKNSEEREFDFIAKNLRSFSVASSALSSVLSPLELALHLNADFRKKAGFLFNRLATMHKTHGSNLVVTEEIYKSGYQITDRVTTDDVEKEAKNREFVTRDVVVGTALGVGAIVASKHPELRESADMANYFAEIAVGPGDDAIIKFFFDLSPVQRELTIGNYRKAKKIYEKAKSYVDEIAMFFSEQNVATLNTWGQHELNQDRVSLSVKNEVVTIQDMRNHLAKLHLPQQSKFEVAAFPNLNE